MLSVTYLLLLETTHVKKQHYTSIVIIDYGVRSRLEFVFLLDIFVSWWPDKCL